MAISVPFSKKESLTLCVINCSTVQTGNVQNWSSDLIERSHLLAASPLVFFSFYTKHVISKYPLFPCTIKAEKNEVANWTSVHHLCWTVKALTDTRWRYKNRKTSIKSNVLHATNSKLKSEQIHKIKWSPIKKSTPSNSHLNQSNKIVNQST